MKKSSIIICLSILGYIFSISTTDNTLFDCEYGEECIVNMKSFTGGYIPKYTILYFRIPINTKNKNAVTVKLLNNEVYPRSIYVFFYSKKPTDEEEMSGSESYNWIYRDSFEKDKYYSNNIYPIDEDYSGKCIVVVFEADDNYHYLSILLSSYKEKIEYMKEIEYNKEHVIKKRDYYLPYYGFWLKAKNNDNEFIRIKLHKDDSDFASEIMLQLMGLKVNPYEIKDQTDIIDQIIFQKYDSNEADGDYIKYYYTYSKLKEGIKYLELNVINYYKLKYFSIGIGIKITDDSGYLKLIPINYAYFALLLWLF